MSATTRLVAEILALLAVHGPTSAYRLRQMIEDRWSQTVAPPMIYRALSRLADTTQVDRLPETRRYVLRAPLAGPTVGLSCEVCGEVTLCSDSELEAATLKLAKAHGFKVKQSGMELVGVCRACQCDEASVAR